MGVDVILYDGKNGQAIADYIGLVPGDGFVMIDGKPVLMKASLLDDIRDTVSVAEMRGEIDYTVPPPVTIEDLYRDSPTTVPFLQMVKRTFFD